MKTTFAIISLFLAMNIFAQEKGKAKEQSDVTNCLLVEKAFISKNGKATEQMELYLRCSIDDYFIKLCESNVTRKQLEKYIDKGIAVKMEINEGEWDSCPGDDYPVQSRVGSYIVIKSIEN